MFHEAVSVVDRWRWASTSWTGADAAASFVLDVSFRLDGAEGEYVPPEASATEWTAPPYPAEKHPPADEVPKISRHVVTVLEKKPVDWTRIELAGGPRCWRA